MDEREARNFLRPTAPAVGLRVLRARRMKLFDLTGRTAIVTGGEGLLGKQHCAAIRECGGTAISLDVEQTADVLCDITKPKDVQRASAKIPRCDILINNAAFNG